MEKVVIVTVIGQEMVERRNRALISATFVVLYIAHLVPTCLCLLHMLGQFCSVTAISELLVCIISSYVHDSLPPIGGGSNSGLTRSCRREAESAGRAVSIKCIIFGIGIGTGELGGAGGLDVRRAGSRRG